MRKFKQEIRDDIATFTLARDGNYVYWVVELCGEIAEFTYEDWADYGAEWACRVLENKTAA